MYNVFVAVGLLHSPYKRVPLLLFMLINSLTLVIYTSRYHLYHVACSYSVCFIREFYPDLSYILESDGDNENCTAKDS